MCFSYKNKMSSYIFSTDNLVVNQIVLERERENITTYQPYPITY